MNETELDNGTHGELITVQARGLAVGGAMACRVLGPEGSPQVGMTAFVPFIAPGETALAKILTVHKRHLEASLVEITQPAPERVTPACPYFGECGGCDIQHLDYPAQLRAKAEMIHGAFRTGGLGELTGRIAEVTPGPPYGYRKRITLHVDETGRVGYFRRGSHSVLPVRLCPISSEPISRLLTTELTLPRGVGPAQLHIELVSGQLYGALWLERETVCKAVAAYYQQTDRVKNKGTDALWGEEIVSRLSGWFESVSVRAGELTFGEPTVEREGVRVPLALGEFSQVNEAVNEKLVAKVLEIARAIGATTACDLYAGSGNFALALAEAGVKNTAVESASALVEAGIAEAERRGLYGKVRFRHTTVERFLMRPQEQVSLLVADPPRAGLGKLAPYLSFAPELILISCDLASAVRDIKALSGAGWQVAEIVPFDMFAQTGHIELLTWLRR